MAKSTIRTALSNLFRPQKPSQTKRVLRRVNWPMERARLARGANRGKNKGANVGVSFVRQKGEDLESLYVIDPIIFNGCNILSSLVNSGWSVDGKDQAAADEFAEWLKKANIDVKIPQIALQLCIHGNAWLENVYNATKTLLADIVVRDPKSMDFQRDDKNIMSTTQESPIMLDDQGKPVGYVQKLPLGLDGRKREILFTPDEITHFVMRKVADSHLGIGLVEPAYKVTLIKLNIEEALGESVFHIGFPTYVMKIGDKEKVEPTLEMAQAYSDMLSDASSKHDFVLPWYTDLKILESGNVTEMRKHLDYYVDMQIAAIGVAKPFVLGSGEGANRATLEFLTEIGDRNVAALQRAIAGAINDSVVRIWSDFRKTPEENRPAFKFNALSRWDTKTHLDLIYRGIEMGAIAPSPEIRKHIASVLNFPFVEGGQGASAPEAGPGEEGDIPPEPIAEEPETKLAKKIIRMVEKSDENE